MAEPHIIHAYRHMYKGLLRAVQYSKPARYVARDQLRRGFRDENAVFDSRKMSRTLRFLDSAAASRGLEHRILKNLLHVAYFRHYHQRPNWKHVQLAEEANKNKHDTELHIKDTAYQHYDMTVAMLNKSMRLCLR